MFPTFTDELFSDFFNPSFLDSTEKGTMPAVNVYEGKDEFTIEVAAPGLEKKDFQINLNNNVLEISSSKEAKSEYKEENVMRREFSYTSFKRSFTLPETANTDAIKASYRDGILDVKIPKRDEAKERPSRQIAIS
ncbi:MAG: Hsp20/alpha crystallin family protein [Bacteroidales bacterium]|nr:Hsp20/alpha crystallin family protein [Bacteroidales bacterium]MBN2748218.1 Hsp20/alpha crystallin family protein [Bacteroidales bacterium]